jgi:hypothetical protein
MQDFQITRTIDNHIINLRKKMKLNHHIPEISFQYMDEDIDLFIATFIYSISVLFDYDDNIKTELF